MQLSIRHISVRKNMQSACLYSRQQAPAGLMYTRIQHAREVRRKPSPSSNNIATASLSPTAPSVSSNKLSQKTAPSLQSFEHLLLSENELEQLLRGAELGWRTDFNLLYEKSSQPLASGNYGKIHVGTHRQSGMKLAVKTLPKVQGQLPRQIILDRMINEQEVMERLQSHTGVIRFFECFEDAEFMYILTELCHGGDLKKYVEMYGPLDEECLATVAYEILKTVKLCHDQWILHGDIKPANWCIKDFTYEPFKPRSLASNLRAIDFGSSQVLGSKRLSMRAGTPLFMSPEVHARNYSLPADIWSVGVTLYWLFCREFPFFPCVHEVKKASLDQINEAICSKEPDFGFGPWRQISPEGFDLIRQCLDKSEKMRPSADDALAHPWFAKHLTPRERALPRLVNVLKCPVRLPRLGTLASVSLCDA